MKIMQGFAARFRQNPWLYALALISLVMLLMYIGFIINAALNQGVNFDGYAADGPFQLYNPLRRLAAGQVPGRDFQFFHGILIPILHYVPFKLLGSNVFASETTRWLLSPFLFLVTAFIFFRLLLKSYAKALVGTGILLIVCLKYVDVIYPSNSLIGVRTTFPILAGAAMLLDGAWRIRLKYCSLPVRDSIVYLFLALAFLSGTEQGVAAIIAYLLLLGTQRFRATHNLKQSLLRTIQAGGIIAAITIVSLTLLTLGHPIKPLTYALVDIPSDQGWYFGAAPNSYLTWHNLIPDLTAKYLLYVYGATVIAIGMTALGWKRKLLPRRHLLVYLYFLLYGLLAWIPTMTGYVAPSQAIPLMRAMLAANIGMIVYLIFAQCNFRFRYSNFLRVALYIAVGLLLVANSRIYFINTKNSFSTKDLLHRARIARHTNDYYAAGPAWRYRIDSFSDYLKPEVPIWSTYTSLYQSNVGSFTASSGGFDYIIHALGQDNRNQYLQDFSSKRPEYVITLKASYFYFEEWLWSRNWPFYKQLLTNYTVVKENGSHYLWKRLPAGQQNKDTGQWQVVKNAGGTFSLPNTTSDLTLTEVRIRYHATSGLPLNTFKGLPRYILKPLNTGLGFYISLPPQQQELSFIVPTTNLLRNPGFQYYADGMIPTANLQIDSFEYRALPTNSQNLRPFYNSVCAQKYFRGNIISASACNDK